jgi:hypothetical protein
MQVGAENFDMHDEPHPTEGERGRPRPPRLKQVS